MAYLVKPKKFTDLYIYTGWTTGVRFSAGAGMFSLRHRVWAGSGAHPASIRWVPWWSFPSVRVAGHLPMSGAEMKNVWGCASTPPMRIHGVVFS
jgi:hypothetical protein